MNNISDILSRYKPTSEIGGKISKELFFIELNKKLTEIFKEKELQFFKPAIIKDNYLVIYCKNSIIASIVKLKQDKILEKIKEIKNQFNIEKILVQINDTI